MARKFSMAHLGCLNWTPAEMIYNAKAIGYDYVSIRPICMGAQGESDYDFVRHPDIFRLTRQAMEETGIKIHDIELAKVDDAAVVANYESAFAAAAELGAEAVISSIWTENKDTALKKFEEVCDLAAKYNLYVGLEFVTWASVWNLEQSKDVLNTIARPNAGVLVDTLHAYRSGVSTEEIRSCPKEWFKFAHICGGPKEIPERTDTKSLIYTGRECRYYLTDPNNGVPAAEMVKAMPEDTVLSIELPNWDNAKNWGTFEHMRRTLETTKQYLKDNGVE